MKRVILVIALLLVIQSVGFAGQVDEKDPDRKTASARCGAIMDVFSRVPDILGGGLQKFLIRVLDRLGCL